MRVAIVGLGKAGSDLHLPALKGIPSVSIVAGCDRDAECRDRVAARWAIPMFTDVDAMLAAHRPEVVIVATPPATHADYCRRALASGAHVVCEKPFASSLEEADSVISAASAADRQIAVNHEFGEMPIFRVLMDQVRSGAAGELRFAQVWQLMDMPPLTEPGWRGEMTHRTLFEAGVHLVDLLIALFGERPVSVMASTYAGIEPTREGDVVVLATLEFSRGRLAHLVQNRLCKGEPQYFEVRADTESASFRASFGGRARLSAGLFRATRPHVRFDYGSSGLAWREVGGHRTPLARNPANPNMLATRDVLEDALEAFRQQRAPRGSAARARDVLEVIAGCYVSASIGERVRLDASMGQRLHRLRMGATGSPSVHA